MAVDRGVERAPSRSESARARARVRAKSPSITAPVERINAIVMER
jgi:hypothetical protein